MFAVSVLLVKAFKFVTLPARTPSDVTLPVSVLLDKALSVVTFARLTTSEAT